MTDGEAIEDQLSRIAKQLEEIAATLELMHDDQPIPDDERSRFAMAALQGLLANPNNNTGSPEELTKTAVLYALKLNDALTQQEEKERAAFAQQRLGSPIK